MQFTRLRLVGFKSFVDPTELLIAPGLTGIVGPNGCGKSNLLEALRWVMGENRARAMRGAGMEDVIFAGTNSRPARNRAEVSLTIDNRDRLAPSGFNATDAIEVVRRISRDAGSAYRANGKEARARDVQMLFADASTGAHSPALVRQGQIADLINAKPTARRRVLEEAAGISGLHQRRHEAELKLRSAETNLGRVDEILDALANQIAALARQARQARRYREIAEALRRAEMLLHCRLWHDAETGRERALASLGDATRKAGLCQTEAAQALRRLGEAEDQLPALREEDAIAGAVLQRLAMERDRLAAKAEEAHRLVAEIESKRTQIAADLERETALNADADGTITRLREEARLLDVEGEGHEAARASARASAEEASAALLAAEVEFNRKSQEAATLLADHRAARRTLDEARRRDDEATRARARTRDALAAAEQEALSAETTLEAAIRKARAAADIARTSEETLTASEAALASAQARGRESAARLAEAEGSERALRAEEAGLETLLARETGSDRQMLDAIAVEDGFEAALGVAFGDALATPALDGHSSGSGWRSLPPLQPQPLPKGIEALAPHVNAPEALARRLAAIGVVPRQEGATRQLDLQEGQCLVSREGDLWRWDGYHLAAGCGSSEAALRLQQTNRLAALVRQLEAARAKADVLREDAAAAVAAHQAAREQETAARAARKRAEQRATEAARVQARAQSALEALRTRADSLRRGLEHQELEATSAQAARAKAEAEAAALRDLDLAQASVETERTRVEGARILMMTRHAEADELARAEKARAKRLGEISRDLERWAERQSSAAGHLEVLERRALQTERLLMEARAQPAIIAAEIEKIGHMLAEAEARRKRAADALAGAETGLRSLAAAARAAETAAGEAREARARLQAQSEAAELAAGSAAERIAAEYGVTPRALLASLAEEPAGLASVEALEDRFAQLRRQRDALGPVNLRAEEDSREVEAERSSLVAEKTDLEEAIRKLRHGIAALNREGRARLLEAFEGVNRNFAMLFRHLFGGGEASLVLVESDDPLEAGLEIMCQPPGKRLTTLSLLSGGEQTLTALSLIFAVFLANPSPICVLDEVDAPLDDANVTRFCDLLDEMTRRTRTRFLIITHHAVTMARMDRLFGVTMAEQGVSKLVSVDLSAAERMVETAVA